VKKHFPVILFIFACFSLNAQDARDIKIYVPPVLGEGRPGDSNFFYQQLTYEVIYHQYTLIRTSSGSDFTLRGAISPEPVLGSPYHIFNLELIKTENSEVIARQNVVYYLLDTVVVSMVSTMAYNMLAGFPNTLAPEDWRNNHLYINAGVMWAPRLYIGEAESFNWGNVGLGLSGEFHFSKLIAAGIGLQFTQDWIVVSQADAIEYRDLILDIPFMFKFVFKPGDLMLEPYTGLSLNLSLMQLTQPSLLSWLIGMQFGVRAGRGSIVIDPRFSLDLFSSSIPSLDYERYTIQVGIGYKYGFMPKANTRNY